jgi:hypothetical protein
MASPSALLVDAAHRPLAVPSCWRAPKHFFWRNTHRMALICRARRRRLIRSPRRQSFIGTLGQLSLLRHQRRLLRRSTRKTRQSWSLVSRERSHLHGCSGPLLEAHPRHPKLSRSHFRGGHIRLRVEASSAKQSGSISFSPQRSSRPGAEQLVEGPTASAGGNPFRTLTYIRDGYEQARSCTTASAGGLSCPHRARTPGASRLRHHVGTSGLSPAREKG